MKTPKDYTYRDKLWGTEEWIVNNDHYCGKILRIKKGASCSLHFHKNKHETFYCLEGEVNVLLEAGEDTVIRKIILKQGNSIEIPPNHPHMFFGTEDSTLIEFSTHHEDIDSYRITQSQAPGNIPI